ncbi:two-component system response regulator [Niabella ginsenosidivorans]|uniref:Two-component system response regulator n=1 Tax=Niabella ginsenosidivorans TaxID=1176587 RepID=A0A1A9I161_9BACT|nr:response regulator [Niabella ginsenosidivorans]ANH80441.1 two-component system response regulator [Niabella ginsenosidivorans]
MNSKHLLIVDDEPAILKLLQFILSKDYTVTLKSNGLEAVLWLEEGNKPDLIILDINMPYFNGQDFFKSLKVSGLFQGIPVIILTGHTDVDRLKAELEFPVNTIISKPFNPTILQNAVRSLLTPKPEVY